MLTNSNACGHDTPAVWRHTTIIIIECCWNWNADAENQRVLPCGLLCAMTANPCANNKIVDMPNYAVCSTGLLG